VENFLPCDALGAAGLDHLCAQDRWRGELNGLCLVTVRGKVRQPGKIKLAAKADGLIMGTTCIENSLFVCS